MNSSNASDTTAQTATVEDHAAGTSRKCATDPPSRPWAQDPPEPQFHVTFPCSCQSCEEYRSLSHDQLEDCIVDPKGYSGGEDYPPIPFDKARYAVNLHLMEKAFTSKLDANLGDKDKYNMVCSYTFMPMDRTISGSVYYLTLLSEYLQFDDLEEVLGGDATLTVNLLRKAMILFVESWAGYFAKCAHSEWSAWKTRKFLAFILQFPAISDKFQEAVGDWTAARTPLTIFESLCEKHLFCVDTLVLLINVTRISGMVEYLEVKSKFMQILEKRFYEYCVRIRQGTKLNDLLLKFLVNLGHSERFSTHAVKSSVGYMVTEVVPDMITTANKNLGVGIGLEIWPYLKNLCIHDAGRVAIMDNADIYIGQILYPIAGPETLTEEEMEGLPDEVKYLPPTKKRVKSRLIKECIIDILFSLCRYKNFRETLRAMNVYVILKNYHIAESDEELLDKIEDLVNVLIRKEESEIAFDDLMSGLALNPEGSGEGDESGEKKQEAPLKSAESN